MFGGVREALRRFYSSAPPRQLHGGLRKKTKNRVFHTKGLSAVDWSSDYLPRILVTGAGGQIGTELIPALRELVSENNVIATDVKVATQADIENGPFYYLDAGDKQTLKKIVVEQRIDYIVHNAAMLSVTAEKDPKKAFIVNDIGQRNVLDVASEYGLRVLAPSSIATFGPTSPLDNTPDICVQRPTTIYGINKVDLELTGEYFQKRYGPQTGFEFRCLRLPGVISAKQKPGGGTTDWAIEALKTAAAGESVYDCWMEPTQATPFLHIDDTVSAMVQVLFAEPESLTQCVYNLGGVSITPEMLCEAIRVYIPGFEFRYNDVCPKRAKIASEWPRSLDGSAAMRDWGCEPRYDLDHIVTDMLDSMSDSNLYPKKRGNRSYQVPSSSINDVTSARFKKAKKNKRKGKKAHAVADSNTNEIKDGEESSPAEDVIPETHDTAKEAGEKV